MLLGELKSPILKKHTIPIKIKRFYTDVNGVIVNKALVPAALQINFPVYLFGDFDRSGGYNIGKQVCPPLAGSFYVGSFTHGQGVPFLYFNGLSNIYEQIKIGDIVHLFADSLAVPTYYIWIVQTLVKNSIASIVSNTETAQKDGSIGKIFVDQIYYFSDTILQWDEPFHITRMDNVGQYLDDQLQPYVYKNPDTVQNDFLDMVYSFKLDQYIMISTYMIYEANEISWNFQIKK